VAAKIVVKSVPTDILMMLTFTSHDLCSSYFEILFLSLSKLLFIFTARMHLNPDEDSTETVTWKRHQESNRARWVLSTRNTVSVRNFIYQHELQVSGEMKRDGKRVTLQWN
jgi:hypothetical protein